MLTPEQTARLDALSRAFRMSQADLGDQLTAERIREMGMSEYAKIRARVLGDDADTSAPTRPTSAPVAVHEAPRGQYVDDVPDFGRMSMTDYAQIRAQYIRPGSGRGIFDGINQETGR